MPDTYADADGPDGSELGPGWKATESGGVVYVYNPADVVRYETDVDWYEDDTPLACGVENPEVCDSCQ